MIQRFAALVLVAGLGTGLVLRIVAGRGRFGTFVVLAQLPVLFHVVTTGVVGFRAGVGTLATGLFLLGGLLIVLFAALLGRRLTHHRAWWAVCMPALAMALYLLAAVLPYGTAMRAADVRLDTAPLFGAILGVVFTVAALVPFVPRPASRQRTPRLPWQR